MFLDLLALQFPQHNHCDIFAKKNNSNVPQQLPGEKCSVMEEVSLLAQMRICNNEAQVSNLSKLVPKLLGKNLKVVPGRVF